MPLSKAKLLSSDKDDNKRMQQAYEDYVKALLRNKKIKKEDADEQVAKAQAFPPVLTFNSKEAADKFFTERAKEKIPFAAAVQDSNGKLTGDYYFSNGADGKLYQGKFKPETIEKLEKVWAQTRANPDVAADINNALQTNNELQLLSALQKLEKKGPAAEGKSAPVTSTSSELSPIPDGEEAPQTGTRPR